jgi:hypothetical protein
MILLTRFCFSVINSNFQLSEHSQGRLCDYSWAVACLLSATIKDDIVVFIRGFYRAG